MGPRHRLRRPVDHSSYHCDTGPKVCNLFDYHAPATESMLPAGLQPDKTTFLTREDLGVDTFAGLEVQKSRETTTIYTETVGNTRTILRTVDYWYSPVLGVNVQVKRHHPRDGDQTLWLADVSLTALDPDKYKAPAAYRIIDHRPPAGTPAQDPDYGFALDALTPVPTLEGMRLSPPASVRSPVVISPGIPSFGPDSQWSADPP